METKEYLEQIQNLKIKIEQKEQELADLEEMLGALPAIRYDTIRVAASPMADQIPNEVIRRDSLATEIRREKEELLQIKHRIINEIQRLKNPIHVELLFKRYVEGKNFSRIAEETHYSYGHVRGQQHTQALKAFESQYTTLH